MDETREGLTKNFENKTKRQQREEMRNRSQFRVEKWV